MLNQVENTILDRYGIDYTGAHVRNMVVSGRVDILSPEIKDSMIAAFNRFSNWNISYFKTIPDTFFFSDGIEYMKNKVSDDFLKLTFNETRKIVGQYSKTVNDTLNNIKTIDILEVFSTKIPNSIEHLILIENFSNYWEILTIYSEFIKIELECGQCFVE